MKKNLLLIALNSVAIISLTTTQSAKAAVVWDIRGDWSLEFTTLGVTFDQNLDITQENFATGAFSGHDTDSPVGFVGGQVSGNSITLTEDGYGGNPSTEVLETGTIGENGTMSGTVLITNDRGTFFTVGGNAQLTVVPEPAGFGLIAGIGLIIAALVRMGRSHMHGKRISAG